MLDGNGSVNEDVAADSVCNTCIGFTYYDKAMQDAKSTFHCYGLRGTAYESSAKEIEKGIVIYPSEFESYACVGKTVSTGGMERRGIPPVRVSGIEFVSSKNIRTKDSKNEQRNKMLRERQLALEEIQSKKNARNEEKESS